MFSIWLRRKERVTYDCWSRERQRKVTKGRRLWSGVDFSRKPTVSNRTPPLPPTSKTPPLTSLRPFLSYQVLKLIEKPVKSEWRLAFFSPLLVFCFLFCFPVFIPSYTWSPLTFVCLRIERRKQKKYDFFFQSLILNLVSVCCIMSE